MGLRELGQGLTQWVPLHKFVFSACQGPVIVFTVRVGVYLDPLQDMFVMWQRLINKVHYGERGKNSWDMKPRKRDPAQTNLGRSLLVYFLSSWFRNGKEHMI